MNSQHPATKKILFFTCDPGGAEVLTPIIHLLLANGYVVQVTTFGHAMHRFIQHGINFTEIAPIGQLDYKVLKQFAPDFVITSATSLPSKDMSEKYLWLNAREMGIDTLAFNDQWQNYTLRFSGPGSCERLSYIPDFINCIDEIGKSEMLQEGFPIDRLLTFGHPHLAKVKSIYADLERSQVLATLGLSPGDWPNNTTLIFVSEAIREHFGAYRGYDQYTVLSHFLENVRRSRPNASVLIKLHPKDDRNSFNGLADQYDELRIHFIQNEISSLECLTLSPHVFGMTSIMLIEAFLIGKTVISLQPGLIVEDPLVLSRHKLIPCINRPIPFDPFTFSCGRDSHFPVDFDETTFLQFLALRLNSLVRSPRQKGMIQP